MNWERQKQLELQEWQLLHQEMRLMAMKRVEMTSGESREHWEQILNQFNERAIQVEQNVKKILDS